MKKTVKISELINSVNQFNASTQDNMQQAREHLTLFVERVLMNAGNYNGFMYLTESELTNDAMSVGIRPDKAKEQWFDNTDHTRVKLISK